MRFAAPVATSHPCLSYISCVQKYVLLSLLVIGMAWRELCVKLKKKMWFSHSVRKLTQSIFSECM